MSWKVLVTARTIHDVGQSALETLRQAGCQVVLPDQPGPHAGEALKALLQGNDAVLATMDRYTDEVFGSPEAARLKIVSRWGVGYDAIDIPAATRHGVVVAYTPGLLDETVADYAFALLLALARRVPDGARVMQDGDWKLLWGVDVWGKTLGILGCGRIGRAVARRASGFQMRLIAHDPFPTDEARALGIEFVSLDELVARSDFLTLHSALTPENRGLIGEARLRQMKPTARLINTARGALVDEAALVRALAEGWIAGAALDAFVTEPLPADHPLRRAPNCLLTPHNASFARETGERVSLAAAQAIVDLQQGRRPRWIVNEPVLNTSNLRAPLLPGS